MLREWVFVEWSVGGVGISGGELVLVEWNVDGVGISGDEC